MMKVNMTEQVAIAVCKKSLHCNPNHIVHIPAGMLYWKLARLEGHEYHEEVVRIMEWGLTTGGYIYIGLSDDMKTLVIAGEVQP